MVSEILYILLALVMLGVLVTVHEFGHYIVGRLSGIGIVEFSVGMGPKIFGWKRKGILYSLRAIPLGGYCSFVGEDEENAASNAMNNQPVWKRLLTVLAGPGMNFLFAIVVAVVLLACFPFYESVPDIYSVEEGTPAQTAGLMAGDTIVEINGLEIAEDYAGVAMVTQMIRQNPEEKISLVVERDGERISLEVTPALVGTEDGQPVYQIGIVFGAREFRYSLGQALSYAPRYCLEVLKAMLESLKNLIFKGEGVQDVGGPVAIVSMISTAAQNGVDWILDLLVIISLNLGLMNLLPIPGLDGGRVLFLLIEAVRRKPIPREKEGMVNAIGVLLVLGLIVLVTFQDVARLIAG